MRKSIFLFPVLLGAHGLAVADFTQVDAVWSDSFFTNDPLMPLSDNAGETLEGGDVIQVGYFQGVDPDKDPATYTAADWASFTPLSGDGSPNADAFGMDTSIDSDFPGYFNFSTEFNTDVHEGVPMENVRVGLRFFDAPAVADATHVNIVSSGGATWIMKKPDSGVNIPFPAAADLDFGKDQGTLVWEGSPFTTDLVPGGSAPNLVLTGVTPTGPTTLAITWTGGDGTNNIETSTSGAADSWTNAATDVASGAEITIDPAGVPTLLIRVVAP